MSGKRSRDKGARYEREKAAELRDSGIFPDAKRNLSETRDGGTGIDLTDTGNLSIQCKRHKNYVPVSTLDEVMHIDGKIPIVITKADGKPDRVIISLEDFKRILLDIGIVYKYEEW